MIQGAAVFLGVLAGILVQLGFQWCMTKHSEAQRVRNLKFELTLNIAKIDTWLEEAVRWRNAVNGNAIATYFGHFDLSRFVYPTLNEMFMSGLLYKYMNHEDIRHLQVVTSEFSFGWERVLNEDVIAAMKANFVQANAVRVVDFWEAKFQGHKATLERIRNKL